MICKCEFCGEQFGSILDCRNHERDKHCVDVKEMALSWNGKEWELSICDHDWSMNDHMNTIKCGGPRYSDAVRWILAQPDRESMLAALCKLKNVVQAELENALDLLPELGLDDAGRL